MESQELQLFHNLNPGQSLGRTKPHKYAVLLAVMKQ